MVLVEHSTGHNDKASNNANRKSNRRLTSTRCTANKLKFQVDFPLLSNHSSRCNHQLEFYPLQDSWAALHMFKRTLMYLKAVLRCLIKVST